MNYIDALKDELNNVFTENGDKAYASSGSYCLDFFALIGGMRWNYKDILPMFVRAFGEDKLLSIKLLFFTRDIRGGLGERNTFRIILNYLGSFYPEIAIQLIDYVPKYGRYDDLFVLLSTSLRDKVVEKIKNQLEEDKINKANGKEISLLSKWMPSINTSNDEVRALAKKLAKYLGLSFEDYRKLLSSLRKGMIIENNLREKDYSFDYASVPSCAFLKYRNCFIRNDEKRISEFLNQVNNNEKKIHTGALYPYQVIKNCVNIRDEIADKLATPEKILQEKNLLDMTWKSFDRNIFTENTIVVRDGSGSMFWSENSSMTPNDVATSLAILFSEQLSGPFKNTFITFSENPSLITLNEKTIFDKVMRCFKECECANTNISKVYSLILKIAVKARISKEDMIKKIIIISDMEFDECAEGMSTYESFKQKYEGCGYDFPELIFWNVSARNVHLPVTQNENNVKLVSGASDKIFEMVMTGLSKTPYEFMNEAMEKYQEFDKIKL